MGHYIIRHLGIYKEIIDSLKKFSTCLSRQTSAILISQNNSIIATGYNGTPRGVAHCSERGCLRENMGSGFNLETCWGAHAEANIIANCALEGIKTKDCILICSTQPCMGCAKAIINSGIKTVIYFEPYNAPLALGLLRESGIIVHYAGKDL